MESQLLKKLGIEKVKVVNKDFDNICDYYNKKAKELGHQGELKFIKEHNKILIYVII
jgi:hypothetical protein